MTQFVSTLRSLGPEVRQTRILIYFLNFFIVEREIERQWEKEHQRGEGEADCPLSGEPNALVLFKNTLLLKKKKS